MAGRSTEEKAGKIGPAIKSKREELGISQLELAVRAETSQSAINAYEQGKRKPRKDTLQRLAEALETTVPVLLGKVRDTDIPLNADERELFSALHRLNTDNQKKAIEAMKTIVDALIFAQKGSNIETTENMGIQKRKQQ